MKRIVAFLLVILTFVSIAMPIHAETNNHQQQAEILKELGLFNGGSNGFELNRQPTRVEAAVMLVRLIGKENEAKNGSWSHPFTDVPTWADNYIGYLYSEGLAKGISASVFGANDKCSASMYTTFVLRTLGYSDTMDFTYNNSLDYAVKIGLLDQSYKNYLSNNQFLRDDMVAISFNSLTTKMKDESLLIDSLIDNGAVRKEDAVNAGLIKPEVKILETGYHVTKFCDNAYLYFDKSELHDMENAYYCEFGGVSIDITDEELKQSLLSGDKNHIYEEYLRGGNVTKLTDKKTYCKSTLIYEDMAPFVAVYDRDFNLLAFKKITPDEYVYGDKHFIRFVGQYNGDIMKPGDLGTVKRFINGVEDTEFKYRKDFLLNGSDKGGIFSTGPLFVPDESVSYEFIVNDPLLTNVKQIVHISELE